MILKINQHINLFIKRLLVFTFMFGGYCSYGQVDSIPKTVDYSFVYIDQPAQLLTMRQTNESYLSAYRLFARGMDHTFKTSMVSDLVQIAAQSVFLLPLTHEEGHRSILTVNNIGSISQPYFNNKGAAYVKGVRDIDLMNLRDTALHSYIRLHGGGLESDYMLTRRMETMGSFGFDEFKYYKWEYWFRKFGILQYYVTGLWGFDIDLEEEENELERDIVGYDTYGAARHLYRPDMEFYRYTKYTDLTGDEKRFVKRMGYRSLLNLLNPQILGIQNIKLTNDLRFNVGMGYTMAPFGDFIDENIWIKYRKYNVHFYLRQFQNKSNWYQGCGLGLLDFRITDNWSFDLLTHYWNQPKDYDFNTSESFAGGAVDAKVRYFVYHRADSWLKAISFDFGMICKTEGFLPEELYFGKHIGFRLGTTLRI